MSADNPYQTDSREETAVGSVVEEPNTGQAAYNVVSDTLTGLNVRKKDNVFQGLFILASVLLGAGIVAVLALLNTGWGIPWYGGAMLGGFAGLVVGFFSSGIFLMIYRAVQHASGKHK